MSAALSLVDKELICKLFNLEDENSIQKGRSDFYSEEYLYINNTDGSIRWIFPKKLKYPTFLKLYNSQSLKAKLFSLAIKFLFYLNLKTLVKSGRFYLNPQSKNFMKGSDNWSFSILFLSVGHLKCKVIQCVDDCG